MKYQRIVLNLLSTAAVLLALPAAHAADLPLNPPPSYKAPMIAPYYNWSGFYVGVNGGYGFGTSQHQVPGVATNSYSTSGAVAGVTAGYNFQINNIVFGIEDDFDWSNMRGGANCTVGRVTFGCNTENSWIGTARGRLGYAFDRWLPYITAGAGFGNIKATLNAPATAPGINQTRIGYALGGGVEYAMWDRWTVKAEYIYVDLGSVDCAASCGAPSDKVKFNANLIRAGVNYRF
jgi:outer membrane immunogenic protein